LIKKLIHIIAAARPNFMKIAPLYHALVKEEWAEPIIVYTGQHDDLNMSDTFFQGLGLPYRIRTFISMWAAGPTPSRQEK
jgi:UDP-N-acetylglucosamine 2-epimerase (non-hydrolysing)